MEMLKNLSKRERVLFIVAVSCILLAIVYRLVMIPVRDGTKDTERQIKLLTGELARTQSVFSQTEAVGSELARLQGALGPSGGDEEQLLLAKLEQLCSQCGASMVDVKGRPTEDAGWAKTYYVEMQMTGDAEQLMCFLARLNAEPGAYRVDNLQVSRKEAKSPDILKVTLLASKMVLAESATASAE